jgi:hypothetical protein
MAKAIAAKSHAMKPRPTTKKRPRRVKLSRDTEAIPSDVVQAMRENPKTYQAVREAVTYAPTDERLVQQLFRFATSDWEVAALLPAQVRRGSQALAWTYDHHHDLHSGHRPRLVVGRDVPSADAELPPPRTYVRSFAESDKWFLCGRRPRKSQGWKLYVSFTPANAAAIVSRVGPLVAEAGYHFKYIKTLELLRKLNAGRYGYTQIGKCFVIYLHRVDRSFIDALKTALTPYCDQNPNVPFAKSFGARLPLYYRYGSYDGPRLRIGARNIEDNRQMPLPPGKKDLLAPFTAAILENPAVDSFLIRYPVFQAVKQKGKCGVFLGLRLASETFQQVVLKIGYHRGQVQPDGSDGCAFLRREHAFYHELAARGLAPLAPALIDALDEPRKVILVLEYIAGNDLLTLLLENRVTIAQLEQCWEVLNQLHAAGLYVVDAKIGNFIATENSSVRILDFEAAGVVGTPPPAFRTFEIDPVLDNPCVADRVHFLVSILYPYERNHNTWADGLVDLNRLLQIRRGSEVVKWALDRLRKVVRS